MKKTILMVAMASLSLTTMADDNIRPGDDFFQYSCGDWMKQHPLPAAYSRYGTFDQLQEDNDKRINAILTELLNGTYPQGSIEQKLSDLYKLAMDSERRNKEGVSPLMPLIDKLEKAGTCEEILQIQLSLAPYGEQAFFYAQFAADEKNATQNILNISQGGLSLAQKEYYLDNDKATAAIREAFKKHIVKMFQLFGYSKKAATAKMRNVMKVETALAKVSKSKTELRDPEANYNKMSLSDFQKRYTHLPLTALMKAQGVEEKHIQEMIVGQPLFLDGADKLVSSITPDEYRDVMPP